ncbi:hypothetical protein WS72_27825 [Burkholderia savannae]|uniref:Uncharacterized protein n=2 Tax=Burkholderia savannae TaxID=1637837 RepID=A0ABR5T5X6_9BURK|nr:hypothetical protein WS72_27825 [Burkholderia savannae]
METEANAEVVSEAAAESEAWPESKSKSKTASTANHRYPLPPPRALTNVAGAGPSRFPFASTPVDKETRKRFTRMRFAALSRSVRARTA